VLASGGSGQELTSEARAALLRLPP